MKTLTPLVYICVAGVLISFGGSLYTGFRNHREESRPRPNVFPTPAMQQDVSTPAALTPAPVAPGHLPVPAR